MRKFTKDSIKAEQLIDRSLKLNTPMRVRLRQKLNKNLVDIIDGESEIVKAISNIPNKEVKKNRLEAVKSDCCEELKIIKILNEEIEDKKTWLIKF